MAASLRVHLLHRALTRSNIFVRAFSSGSFSVARPQSIRKDTAAKTRTVDADRSHQILLFPGDYSDSTYEDPFEDDQDLQDEMDQEEDIAASFEEQLNQQQADKERWLRNAQSPERTPQIVPVIRPLLGFKFGALSKKSSRVSPDSTKLIISLFV